MNNKTKISIIALILGIIMPWVIVYTYGLSHSNDLLFTLQYIALGIILVVSIYIFLTNIRLNKKNIETSKLAPMFIIISIVAFFYSLLGLIAMYSFRNFGF